MGLLTTTFAKARGEGLTPAASDDYWYGKVAQGTTAGVRVDEDTALNYSACWAATRLIAETPASLPLYTYRHLEEGGKALAPEHWLWPILHHRPNPIMDSFTFWESRMAHAANWGNGFAEIEWTKGGRVLALWPIHPSRVKRPGRDKQGELLYPVLQNDGTTIYIKAENMFHLTGVLAEDGLWGKGVISQARESIGLGLATERYGSAFFGNGARPGGVIETPNKYSDIALQEYRRSWNQVHQGPSNAHQLGVLWQGAKYHPIDVPPEDAQFLSTRQHNITEIARWYRIPVHMLAELTRSTNNNIEAENLGLVIHTIRPWIVRLERAIARQLLKKDADRYFAEFLLDALLRGDTWTRTQSMQMQFFNGAISLDEWRATENRNPLPNGQGKAHFVQSAMIPLAQAIAGPTPGSGERGPGSGAPGADVRTPPDPASRAPLPDTLLDLPDIRQEDNYSCGAAVAMSVGKYFGVGPDTLEEWKAALGTTPEDSTRPAAIAQYLTDLGLAVTTAHDMTVEDLRACWMRGRPVICPVQEYGLPSKQASFDYGHYVAVIGVALGQVFVQDPSIDNVLEGQGSDQTSGRSLIDETKWMEVWHDRDADGKNYIHFGIAVAERPAPAEETATAGDDDEGGTQSGEEEQGQLRVAQKGGTLCGTPQGVGSPTICTPAEYGERATQGEGATHAAGRVVDETVARLTRIEINEATRAARDPSSFVSRLDAFYQSFESKLTEALSTPIAAARAAGLPLPTPAELAGLHVRRHRDQLLHAAECRPEQLAAAVQQQLNSWAAPRAPLPAPRDHRHAENQTLPAPRSPRPAC